LDVAAAVDDDGDLIQERVPDIGREQRNLVVPMSKNEETIANSEELAAYRQL
jgi:hypothetical protein